jgi:hypothetical protein
MFGMFDMIMQRADYVGSASPNAHQQVLERLRVVSYVPQPEALVHLSNESHMASASKTTFDATTGAIK